MKKYIFAESIRKATTPPVTVIVLLLLLFFLKTNCFTNPFQLFLFLFFLGIFPILAYPLSYILPRFKHLGRSGQRNLAFVLNIIGYTIGMILSFILHTSFGLKLVATSYWLAVVILTLINVCSKYRASGHACCSIAPIIILTYYFGYKVLIIGAFFIAIVYWASLFLKRHTKQEFILGLITFIIAFIISFNIIPPSI